MVKKSPDIQLSGQLDWLHNPALRAVLDPLDAAHGNARVVGGAVRNALMGLPIADVDIATIWSPEQVIGRLESMQIRTVETGKSHGTITAIVDGKSFEITTLRVDVSSDGRHAEVAFTDDWTADAARRDFTINALYLNGDGSLFDPLGGYKDIEDRKVRFIGNPDDRIREDYLRVLRFFRFHAQFAAGKIDPEGLAACIRARSGIRSLSSERVRAELLRLLMIENCMDTVEIAAQTGILTDLLGGVAYSRTLRNLADIQRAHNYPPDALLRLMVLGCKIKEDAERLSLRFRLSKSESRRMVRALDRYWTLSPASDEIERKALLYRMGEETYCDLVLMAWANADADAKSQTWRELFELPQFWSAPVFPITAAMAVQRGVETGKILGNILRRAETAWIQAGFSTSPREVETILTEAIFAENG